MGRDAPPPAAASGRRHGVYLVHTSPEHAWSVPGDAPVLNGSGTIVVDEFRASVGLLTHNVVIQGTPPFSPLDKHGAHVMLHSRHNKSMSIVDGTHGESPAGCAEITHSFIPPIGPIHRRPNRTHIGG